MSKNSFKVKNGLTLNPIDPSEIVNPEAGDLIADSTDDNKIKRYDATSADWSSVGGSAGIGGNLMPEFEKLTPDLVNVTSAVDTVTFLPIDDNNKSIKATFSGSVGSIQFQAPVDSSLHEIQGTVSVWIRTSVQNLQISSVQDGVKLSTLPVSATNKWKQYELPVVIGGTEMGFIVESTIGVTGDVYIDQPFVGLTPSSYGFEVAQGELVGTITWAGTTNCDWGQTTSNSTFTGYTADADCPTPSVTGDLIAPSTKIPAFQLNTKIGSYKIVFNGSFTSNYSATGRLYQYISDGSNTFYGGGIYFDTGGVSTQGSEASITFVANSSSASLKQFQLGAITQTTGLNATIINSPTQGKLTASVYYYPPKTTIVTQQTTELARTLGTLTFAPSANCIWSNTKTTSWQSYVADADCNNPTSSLNIDISHDGTKTPHFILPAGSKAGQYHITVNGGFVNVFNTVNSACLWRYSDGSTNHTSVSASYIPNGDNWDSSKTFVLNLSSDLSSATKFDLQSVALTAGAGACELVNMPYTGSNLRADITVDYKPTSKSTMIVGQFEQIKSTELYNVRLDGNDNASIIAANTGNIQFNELSDPFSIWDSANRYMTVPSDGAGFYSISGNIRAAGSIDPVFYAYIDTGLGFNQSISLSGNIGAAQSHHIQGVVYLNAGDKLAIRSNTGFTVQNLSNLHWLTIKQEPDLAGIVKNLNDNKNVKCQTKYMTSTTSSTGIVSALTFNNLDLTKKYTLAYRFQVLESTVVNNQKTFTARVEYGDGTDIAVVIGGASNLVLFRDSFSETFGPFQPLNSTIRVDLTDMTNVILNGQTPPTSASYLKICELPDNYIETDEW
jgi:hypothetical protein